MAEPPLSFHSIRRRLEPVLLLAGVLFFSAGMWISWPENAKLDVPQYPILVGITGVMLLLSALQPRSGKVRKGLMSLNIVLAIPQSLAAVIMILVTMMAMIWGLFFTPVFLFFGWGDWDSGLHLVMEFFLFWLSFALVLFHLSLNWIIVLHCHWIPFHPECQSPEARTYLTEKQLLLCGGFLGLHRFYRKQWVSGILFAVTLGGLGVLVIRDLTRLTRIPPDCLKPKPVSPPPSPPTPAPTGPPRQTRKSVQFLAALMPLIIFTLGILELLPYPPLVSVPLALTLAWVVYVLLVMIGFLLRNRKHPDKFHLVRRIPMGMFRVARLLPRHSEWVDRFAIKRQNPEGISVTPVLNGTLIQPGEPIIDTLRVEALLKQAREVFREWTGQPAFEYPSGLQIILFRKHDQFLRYLRPYIPGLELNVLGLYCGIPSPRILTGEEWSRVDQDFLEPVLVHEAVHALHLPACQQGVPPEWIMEGLSQHLSHLFQPMVRPAYSLLHKAAQNGQLLKGTAVIRPRKKTRNESTIGSLLQTSLFYAQSHLLFSWLAENQGDPLRTSVFRAGANTPDSFRALFGQSPDEAMDEALKLHLEQPVPPAPGASPKLTEKITSTLCSAGHSKADKTLALASILRLPHSEALQLLRLEDITLPKSLQKERAYLISFLS